MLTGLRRAVRATAVVLVVAVAASTGAAPAAQAAETPTVEIRGREVPLDGQPLPDDLSDAERRTVYEAALAARSARDQAVLAPGEGPDWLPTTGVVELWCTQSNPGYGGCSGHHDRPAIDIGLAVGTPVHAAGPGVVVVAEANGGGRGTYVDVLHPDGSSSHYLHLSELRVTAGQVVDRGEVLGLSGSTGSSTAPHLHYEERGPDGRPRPIGPLLGQVGDEVVSYPVGLFGLDWPEVPYGTLLANDGYVRPTPADFDGDGRNEQAAGTIAMTPADFGVSSEDR